MSNRAGSRLLARSLLATAVAAILFFAGLVVGSRFAGRPRATAAAPVAVDVALSPTVAPAPVSAERPLPAVSGLERRPPLALVIDDLGRSLDVLDRLRELAIPLTYAVLPYESRSGEVARVLAARGEEVLCHLPMEAQGGVDPGPGALLATMSPAQLRAAAERALRAVPGAQGVNNHMGSVLSTRSEAMRPVLELLKERRLFFLDSRTSPSSVGYRLALDLGVAAAERQVFLDGDPRPAAIRHQFQRLLRRAREDGYAIAIGHPHAATIETLKAEVPAAIERGFRFVKVSQLLETGDAGTGTE